MSKESLCIANRLNHICGAEKNKQKDCRYYEKNSFLDQCMYFKNDINMCDCLKAHQSESKKEK